MSEGVAVELIMGSKRYQLQLRDKRGKVLEIRQYTIPRDAVNITNYFGIKRITPKVTPSGGMWFAEDSDSPAFIKIDNPDDPILQ